MVDKNNIAEHCAWFTPYRFTCGYMLAGTPTTASNNNLKIKSNRNGNHLLDLCWDHAVSSKFIGASYQQLNVLLFVIIHPAIAVIFFLLYKGCMFGKVKRDLLLSTPLSFLRDDGR